MKILFVNTNIGYGGASKMMATVANACAEKHDVTFLTFRNAEIKQPLSDKVKFVFDSLFESKIKPLEMLGQIRALRRYIKRERFDLAVAFLWPSHYMTVLAAKGTKTKVLLSERADPVTRAKNRTCVGYIFESIIRRADAYVFQSDGAANAYPKRCRERGTVIVNALPDVDYPVYAPDEAQKSIVCVARFENRQKRLDVLVDAFAIFCQTRSDYVLRLVGDGPDEGAIKERVKASGIADKVEFCGARKDVLAILAKSTIFALSADYEGIPNALLEAMAVGVPSVSTDCSPGGARMVVDDGVNGLITPCGDPAKLAEALGRLADDAELRRQFSQNAAVVKTKFAPEKARAAWLEAVERLGTR